MRFRPRFRCTDADHHRSLEVVGGEVPQPSDSRVTGTDLVDFGAKCRLCYCIKTL